VEKLVRQAPAIDRHGARSRTRHLSPFKQKIHKLPETATVLARYQETDLQFASRRIAFAATEFILRAEVPTFSELMRAGIGSSTRRVPGVEVELRRTVVAIQEKLTPAVQC
jgi:hypothetical protein